MGKDSSLKQTLNRIKDQKGPKKFSDKCDGQEHVSVPPPESHISHKFFALTVTAIAPGIASTSIGKCFQNTEKV